MAYRLCKYISGSCPTENHAWCPQNTVHLLPGGIDWPLVFFKTASLRFNSHSLQFTLLKCEVGILYPRIHVPDCRFDRWVRKVPWRRAWQPTPIFLPGEFHGQRTLAGYSPWGHKESDMTEVTEHAHMQGISQWCLAHSQSWVIINTTDFENIFITPKINPISSSSDPSFSLVSYRSLLQL